MSADLRVDAHRIVAIGASAGGLEPLEQLFAALPADTGCSFVIVQHLSPDFRSMMRELLARHTGMPIEHMSHGLTLEPNRVYLNLPRVTATLVDGILKLEKMAVQDDLYRPIDRFLGSLANERGECALAVILSGTASDGAIGTACIKEHGGQVIAQSPQSARFDSMPQAVIDADLADAVGDPATIAALVVRWAAGERLEASTTARIEGDSIGSILALIRRRFDIDIEHYKPDHISRRIDRRARIRQCRDLDAYFDLLLDDANELDELYGDLLIEVTAFFRDRDAFAEIESRVVPALIEKLMDGESLRLWIAGCASGEEAYSIAMLVIEGAERAGAPIDVKILATDVHTRSLQRANAGAYPRDSVAHLPAERVRRFFDVHEDSVQVKSEVRRLLLFSTHDVLRDTPFTRIDLLSCRNLLSYFNDDAQAQALAKFHFALRRHGILVLGPGESTAGLADEFEVLDERWRLFRKRRISEYPGTGQDLSDEYRYYQSLYLNLPIMMFLADDQSQVIELSDRLLELLGRSRTDVVDKPALSLFVPVHRCLAAAALTEGQCRDLAVTLDLGDNRTLECEMNCQLRDIGSLSRIRMCVLIDVSARNRALAAAEDHNRRLSIANESLNQFAFIAAHDLQEPLRKIQQFSSFLLEDYADRVDDDGRYHLKVIATAAERMSTLIKDLLTHSRTSRNTAKPGRLSLHSTVKQVLDDLELPVREARAEVRIGELPVLCADPVLVRQLFTNLIGNALKYRDDERTLILSIGLVEVDRGDPEHQVIELSDNGIGFDPAYAERIFEPFTRLNTVREYPGSGIGLAICATVCEQHGWTLSADSVPGQGSTFRLQVAKDHLDGSAFSGTGAREDD